jgi:hypothetical protein
MPEDFDHHGRLEEKLEVLRRTSPEHAREFLIVLLDDAFKNGLNAGADDEARRAAKVLRACKGCCCEEEEEHHHHHHHHHDGEGEREVERERGERDRR